MTEKDNMKDQLDLAEQPTADFKVGSF